MRRASAAAEDAEQNDEGLWGDRPAARLDPQRAVDTGAGGR